MPEVLVQTASWAADRDQLSEVRRAVFIDEQGVPAGIEMDGRDADCHHLLATTATTPIGTVRLLSDGRIGRLAVIKPYRGRGIGRQLLLAVLATARSAGFKQLYLHAQSHAQGFYAAQGFKADGDEFEEAGIDHINMVLTLTD